MAQGSVEIDSVLYAIGVDNNAVVHRLLVVLFDQLAVCSQLQDMPEVGLFSSTAFDLDWNQASVFSFYNVVGLAADVKRPAIERFSRAVEVRVDHLSIRNSVGQTHGFYG